MDENFEYPKKEKKQIKRKMSIHPIFEHFNYDEATNKSKCLVVDCSHPIMTGKHTYNLKKHLERKHRDVLPQLAEEMSCYLGLRGSNIVKKKTKAMKITIDLSREQFLMGCMEMVTINGRAFSTMRDSGVQRIFGPIQNAFKLNDISTQINAEQLQRHASAAQTVVRNKIKSEIRGKLFALQLDLTNHFHRRILGVNAQFSIENKTVVRVLAMRRLTVSTSSINLAHEVEKILKEYEVEVDDIYTVTTDNGPNVLCCSTVLQIIQERRLETFLSNQHINTVDLEMLNELIEIEAKRILQGQTLYFLHKIHCSAHTYQLAIGDTVEYSGIKETIAAGRDLVKQLRTPNVRNLLIARNMKMAVLDSDTRWSSVHSMVSILLRKTSNLKYKLLTLNSSLSTARPAIGIKTILPGAGIGKSKF